MPVQRVRRVIRKIDPWTVLKVSLVFNAVMALVTVLGLVVFWSVFVNAGIPERLNELALDIGMEEGISFDGPTYFRIAVLLGVVGTILMTGLFTLGAVIYNLISDLVGGVEFVVLEETSATKAGARGIRLPVTVAPAGKSRLLRSLTRAQPAPPPAPVEEVPAAAAADAGVKLASRAAGEATRQTGT